MHESDIPHTAVSTPSGMLWEWLVMPQGFSNAPATFNRLVNQLLRPLRTFEQTYFDDMFVHSRACKGQAAIEVHVEHLRQVFEVRERTSSMPTLTSASLQHKRLKFSAAFLVA